MTPIKPFPTLRSSQITIIAKFWCMSSIIAIFLRYMSYADRTERVYNNHGTHVCGTAVGETNATTTKDYNVSISHYSVCNRELLQRLVWSSPTWKTNVEIWLFQIIFSTTTKRCMLHSRSFYAIDIHWELVSCPTAGEGETTILIVLIRWFLTLICISWDPWLIFVRYYHPDALFVFAPGNSADVGYVCSSQGYA